MTKVRSGTPGHRRTRSRGPARRVLLTVTALLAGCAFAVVGQSGAVAGVPGAAVPTAPTPAAALAADCYPQQSGAAVPTKSSGRDAVRTTIGVAKTMGISTKGQIIAVMVMYQESSIRNLANDGSSTQNASWSSPGKAYWMSVTRLSLKYPHDKFGSAEAAHDTDSVGLYQQRPSSGWGNYGQSTGTTDPEGVIQRLLDPRWEAMAFFGGPASAAPTSGLLDIAGWESMSLTLAANAVQRSNYPEYYAKWEAPATDYVNANLDAPAIPLPWTAGGGGGALACTSIPTDPAAGEAGRNPLGFLDAATVVGSQLQVAGWAFDPDAANGITQIHFYDQGPFGTTGYPIGVANLLRDDVNRIYNVVGKYGYQSALPLTGPGPHTICAYAINVGRGTSNTQIGCRDAVVPGPQGSLDGAGLHQGTNQIDVVGWAADPAAPGAREEVHIYVTGPRGTRGVPGTYTGDSRPDVARVYPWAGGTRGFHATVPSAGPGANQVCVYAINVNPPRNNPQIGCRTVTVPADPPFGNVDAVTVSGRTATVTGWALDQSSPGTSIGVHIYVTNGVSLRAWPFLADDARTDVNTVFGVSGRHGFSRSVTLFPGANQVCSYAIGVNPGNNAVISCRGVTAPSSISAQTQEPAQTQEQTPTQTSTPAQAAPTTVPPPAPTLATSPTPAASAPAPATPSSVGSAMTTRASAPPDSGTTRQAPPPAPDSSASPAQLTSPYAASSDDSE